VRREFFDVNAKMIEHIQQIIFQVRLPVLLLNLTDDFLRWRGPERIQFQQPVAPLFEPPPHFTPRDAGGLQQLDQLRFRRRALGHRKFQRQIVNRPPKLVQQFVAAFEIGFKRIQSFVIPARQNFLRTVRQIRNMDLDVRGLPNAIQPPYPLFEQFGIQRQIE
jgi:hypothetical protein